MAQKRPVTTRKRTQTKKKVSWNLPLGRDNFKWLGIAVGVILFGYLLLSFGMTEEAAEIEGTWNNFASVTLAPIILVIGYCVLVPYAILKGFKTGSDKYTVHSSDTGAAAESTPSAAN